MEGVKWLLLPYVILGGTEAKGDRVSDGSAVVLFVGAADDGCAVELHPVRGPSSPFEGGGLSSMSWSSLVAPDSATVESAGTCVPVISSAALITQSLASEASAMAGTPPMSESSAPELSEVSTPSILESSSGKDTV